MMDDLTSLLAQMAGIEQESRQHRLAWPEGPSGLVVERWCGEERLSQGYTWWVDFLSTDAELALEEWLGQPVKLLTRNADGSDTTRSGLIHEAQQLGSDGGLARYRIGLVPWTWWLEQGRHSRVFQERTLVEIVEAVFAAYRPQANWRWSEETASFLSTARKRSYCVQYRESDAAFVSRLLAEEGLGWRWEEDAEASAGHRLVIFADSGNQAQDPTSEREGGIRYHRSDATEAKDSILGLGREHRLGSSQLTLLSADYKTRNAVSTRLPLQGGGQQVHEDYDVAGMYAWADSGEADRYARLMAQARESQGNRWQGHGSARSLRAGTWFRLTQSEHDVELLLTGISHAGENNLPVDARSALENLLGKPAPWPQSVDRGSEQHAEAVGYANRFDAVERIRPWRPVLEDGTGARPNPRPTAAGYQSATVVGEGGAREGEVHADALGRIKLKFHFQQGEQADDRDSCWVRVAQRYAGPGVGSQFLPRIGQEVLVGFLDGDIDRPLVMGALYNGKGEAGIPATPGGQAAEADTRAYAQARDHSPSAQANLSGGNAPAWHAAGAGDEAHRNAGALWGIKSREWHGQGYSQLVFDDSDAQLRLQLATTQAYSQLNLGHLIHQADNYRGSFRGEGFELRTDAWGAVRGESGLWLTAYGHDGSTPAGEATQQSALLQQLQTLGKTFSEAAGTHLTAKLSAHEGTTQANSSQLIDDQSPLQAMLTSVKTTVPGEDQQQAQTQAAEHDASPGQDKVPQLGDPLLGLAAPAGIGLIAGQSLHWSAGETLTLAAGQGSEAAVAGDTRLHSGQAIGILATAVEGAPTETALSVVSGEGQLDWQAQNDEMRLQAKEQLKLVSANAQVELAAGKTIHLATAGGASVTIEGGNITFACPGNITVQASKKSFVGPVQQSYPLPLFPESVCIECLLQAMNKGQVLSPKNA